MFLNKRERELEKTPLNNLHHSSQAECHTFVIPQASSDQGDTILYSPWTTHSTSKVLVYKERGPKFRVWVLLGIVYWMNCSTI